MTELVQSRLVLALVVDPVTAGARGWILYFVAAVSVTVPIASIDLESVEREDVSHPFATMYRLQQSGRKLAHVFLGRLSAKRSFPSRSPLTLSSAGLSRAFCAGHIQKYLTPVMFFFYAV
jgi:hypothetical protein